MKLDKTRLLLIGGSLLVVLVILVVRKIRIDGDKKKIEKNIADGTGGTGNQTIENVLDGVKSVSYSGLDADCKTIYMSRGADWTRNWLDSDSSWADNEKAVFTLLAKRTKGQIAAIKNRFPQLYAKNLGEFLDSFMDDKQLKIVADTISRAK